MDIDLDVSELLSPEKRWLLLKLKTNWVVYFVSIWLSSG